MKSKKRKPIRSGLEGNLVRTDCSVSQSPWKLGLTGEEVRRLVLVPLILVGFFTVFVLLYRALELPNPEELIQRAESLLAEHGYWVVFVAALAEGLLLVGWYLPGSLVIVFAMVVSRDGILNPYAVVGTVILAFFVSVILNYILGRFGWYRLLVRFGLASPLEKMRLRAERKGARIIFATYFHPNVGTLAATSLGILQAPFGLFCLNSALALVVWNSLWGVAAFIVGPSILKLLNLWIAIPALLAWASVRIAVHMFRRRNLSGSSDNTDNKGEQ